MGEELSSPEEWMGHLGKHEPPQIPSPSGGNTWSWCFFFIWCVLRGQNVGCSPLGEKAEIRISSAASSSLPGEAKLPLTLAISMFFIVPSFVQNHCERGGGELFIYLIQGWGGEVRWEVQGKMYVVVVMEGNGLYQGTALIPPFKTVSV